MMRVCSSEYFLIKEILVFNLLPWMRRVCPARWKVSNEYFRGVFDCSMKTAYSLMDMFLRSNIGDSISLKTNKFGTFDK